MLMFSPFTSYTIHYSRGPNPRAYSSHIVYVIYSRTSLTSNIAFNFHLPCTSVYTKIQLSVKQMNRKQFIINIVGNIIIYQLSVDCIQNDDWKRTTVIGSGVPIVHEPTAGSRGAPMFVPVPVLTKAAGLDGWLILSLIKHCRQSSPHSVSNEWGLNVAYLSLSTHISTITCFPDFILC